MIEFIEVKIATGGYPPALATGVFRDGELESYRITEPPHFDDTQPISYILDEAQIETIKEWLRDAYRKAQN